MTSPIEMNTEPLERACATITSMRQKPLLILYYDDYSGVMSGEDVRYCYKVMRSSGLSVEEPLPDLDVLVHTSGGDPTAAYRLAKCIRHFAKAVSFLVPEYAYSAGTLLCLSGNEVRFGHNAGLSPIDISLESENERIELTAIDYFIKFVSASQDAIQGVLRKNGVSEPSPVGSDLLVRLVDQVQAIKVGSYYRQRTLTGHYAEELLDQYMLVGFPNSSGRRNRIVQELLFSAPAHEFHVDHERSAALGLVSHKMSTKESDATKGLVEVLADMKQDGHICQSINDWQTFPFFFLASPQEDENSKNGDDGANGSGREK